MHVHSRLQSRLQNLLHLCWRHGKIAHGPTPHPYPHPQGHDMILNLADGIAEVSLNLAGLTDAGRRHRALSVLPEFGRAAGQWPAPSCTGAGPELARCVLRGEASSPKLARDFTHRSLLSWSLSSLTEDAEMVVSELVTNAVRHGLSDLRSFAPTLQLVLLKHERRLVVVVTDPGDQVPALSERGDFAETGRGLRIVAALSGAWGWAPLVTGGKAVWAAFDLPATVAR